MFASRSKSIKLPYAVLAVFFAIILLLSSCGLSDGSDIQSGTNGTTAADTDIPAVSDEAITTVSEAAIETTVKADDADVQPKTDGTTVTETDSVAESDETAATVSEAAISTTAKAYGTDVQPKTDGTTVADTDSTAVSDKVNTTVSEAAITTTAKADEDVPDESEAVTEGDDNSEYETVFVNSDYPYYNSLQELYDAADLVIVARNNRNESTILNTGNEIPYTVSSMSVTDVFKGDKSVDSIDVKQLGGLMDGVMYISQGVEQLVQDGEYLLFLETYDKSPAALLNPVQGMYYVEGSTVTARPENSIAVTLEDLSALSAGTVS